MTETKNIIQISDQVYTYFSLHAVASKFNITLSKLPYTIRILLENLLAHYDADIVTMEKIEKVAKWQKVQTKAEEIAYYPSRVVMQDFTGVPCIVDFAALRDAMLEHGGDPADINPQVPIDLIVDHSVQVDFYGSKDALSQNLTMEYQRNKERYALLKWSQKAFDNMRVFPPGAGIVHQVNLEYIATVVSQKEIADEVLLSPDTLIGTDSHTTMINGLGVMGWGVGGIEAEAVALGQPYSMKIPEVIGVHLSGKLPVGATATDMVLRVTERLREEDVVDKFVEYFGEGMQTLSLPDRATIANMAPEYGATMGFFPVDEETLRYMRLTNRSEEADIAEAYLKTQTLFYDASTQAEYSKVVELDLGTIVPSIAGPSRPQDRIALHDVKSKFLSMLQCDYGRKIDTESLGILENEMSVQEDIPTDSCRVTTGQVCENIMIKGKKIEICDGSVVIAAITSCTNTSNPSVMIAAGLLARNAVQKGLSVPAYVKTSLAPGSKVVEAYLEAAGLLSYLETLGFEIVGYGCTTCIGNSGPLDNEIQKAIVEKELIVSAVLSGNSNFEARIHPQVKTNFLASPPLVLAYALVWKMGIDFEEEAIGTDSEGNAVYLRDIWPAQEEIDRVIASIVTPDMFADKYADILEGEERWKQLKIPEDKIFHWNKESTYLRLPPYFDAFKNESLAVEDISKARVLLLLGDSVTTDHISPAGKIPVEYPAGQYLLAHHVEVKDFNSYGSRRGNHEVMMRGTFANERIKNRLIAPKEGGYTLHFPEKEEMFVYDAAMCYQSENVPLVVLAGDDYGMGSSRDWAAKGTQLLGVKAVIATSYERIHRNNLVGMGVLPLEFKEGESAQTLGLDGSECFSIEGLAKVKAGELVHVSVTKEEGSTFIFDAHVRLDTPVNLKYYQNGGILPYVLRQRLKEKYSFS
ncbi:aconitate hydratase AcnA [Sulfurovum sp.]|uniref:aconitate hydratase AcnA n=1 Tax=Sulfurovum sp. TaxID=1969726 RepID=UPI0025E4DA85|nr:aconitate hydratase AcnA [Sulfurovum sp.]